MTDQFAPIDKPYLRLWQQRVALEELEKSIKTTKRKRDRLADPKPAKVKPKPRKKGKRKAKP